MTQTVTPADFLLARIAEDEAYIGAYDDRVDCGVNGLMWDHEGLAGAGARILAECEAKRAIVSELRALMLTPNWEDDHATSGRVRALTFTVEALAAVYAPA